MTLYNGFFASLEKLKKLSSSFSNEANRISIHGDSLDGSVRESLINLINSSRDACFGDVIVRAGGGTLEEYELEDDENDGGSWSVFVATSKLASTLKLRSEENVFFFISVEDFHSWLECYNAFFVPSGNEPDFENLTSIVIKADFEPFGNSKLWVRPVEMDLPTIEGKLSESNVVDLPSKEEVHKLIHVSASIAIRVSPVAHALTWGELHSDVAKPLVNVCAKVMAACLVSEFIKSGEGYKAIIKGTKRLTLDFDAECESADIYILQRLMETVSWVYSERAETRLQLVMDRLSIDVAPSECLMSGMQNHLAEAYQQARESYSFVILERKDAYYKELREIMKDMKSQADLYAAKVRDLVNALTRDALAMLLFIGISFIGKFDKENIRGLLDSQELSLLSKALSVYLIASILFQALVHLRDSHLSYKESKDWINVLNQYTSSSEREEKFSQPLYNRKLTLNFSILVAAVVYFILAFLMWNLPCFIKLLLAQG